MSRLSLLSLLLLVACDRPGPLPAPGNHEALPVIIDGAPPDRPEHDAVVALHLADGHQLQSRPFCSGTLIDDDLVLTAAHCTDPLPGPRSVAVYVGDHPEADEAFTDHVYAVTEILVHPDWYRPAMLHDISVLRLAEAPDETDRRVPPLPSRLALTDDDVGTMMNFAGFGYDEDQAFGRKLQVDVPLGGLGCAVQGCPGAGDPETQISYHQPDGGPCSGDSGGPMFVYRGGDVYVGGVTSYGDDSCAQYGVSTKVDAYGDFLAPDTAPPPPPMPADAIVINEIMVDPSSSDWYGEWVELVNTSDQPVDLSGWTISDDTAVRHAIREGTVLQPDRSWLYVDGYGLDNRGGDRVLLAEPDGSPHAEVWWAVDARTGISLTRAVDGDPDAELLFHDEHPEADGAPSSPYARADGSGFQE